MVERQLRNSLVDPAGPRLAFNSFPIPNPQSFAMFSGIVEALGT